MSKWWDSINVDHSVTSTAGRLDVCWFDSVVITPFGPEPTTSVIGYLERRHLGQRADEEELAEIWEDNAEGVELSSSFWITGTIPGSEAQCEKEDIQYIETEFMDREDQDGLNGGASTTICAELMAGDCGGGTTIQSILIFSVHKLSFNLCGIDPHIICCWNQAIAGVESQIQFSGKSRKFFFIDLTRLDPHPLLRAQEKPPHPSRDWGVVIRCLLTLLVPPQVPPQLQSQPPIFPVVGNWAESAQ
ncbi:hypothetical protein BS47DRAFT_1368813 [Hydnum rufescens UP504]|uniref:Uncharacterized protein n=1 Tax=Hydnum rufescens UP504 TaxID=1448309 RepID=A0A9P6DMS0_9AGAM|nr:hypothetical protein BS47DRAFT_1368813 [Hydnum rufescens UP504]